MKSVIDDKNYSVATKALEGLAEADRQVWEKVKNAGKERQTTYAERLDKGLEQGGLVVSSQIKVIKKQQEKLENKQKVNHKR